ncbi:MAG: hypothetical protein ACYC1M_04340 [Armatimonadota bacterium]
MPIPNPSVEIIHSTFIAVAKERLTPSPFVRAIEWLLNKLGHLFSWLEAPIRFIAGLVSHFYILFIVILALLIIWMVFRYMRKGSGTHQQSPPPEKLQKWREQKAQAQQAYQNGDFLLVVRLSLTACLLLLNEKNLVKMRKGATNSEYLRMMHRSVSPMVYLVMRDMVSLFNDVVYGARDVRSENAEYMLDRLSQIEAIV